MSTKKKVVIFISFFIVFIAVVFVMNRGDKYSNNDRIERQSGTTQAEREKRQQAEREKRQQADVRLLEKRFRDSKDWRGDDEDEIARVKDDAFDLRKKVSSLELRERLNSLIKKCKDEL